MSVGDGRDDPPEPESVRAAPVERAARLLIGLASALVPAGRRDAWREEWEAELWHHVRHRRSRGAGGASSPRLLLRCLGAFPHAVWILGEEWNVESIWQDVRYAVRILAKRPGFAAVAVTTLALGIGGTTAMFSVVDAVLLRPLPIENADRLVWTWGRRFSWGNGASVSPPDFVDYRAGTEDVFERLAAHSSFVRTMVAQTVERPEELRAREVTADFLDALGSVPAAGRTFTTEETGSTDADVVMISHGLWGRMFGFDASAVGSTLRLDGEPYTIVGVLPPDLTFPADLDLWLPLTFGGPGYDARGAHFLRPVGLLREGVSLEQAQTALDRVSARLEAAFPDTNEGWYAVIEPLHEVWVGSARSALLVLLAGVVVVLLVACTNVANLLLARAAGRRGEIAVRTAMGASGLRLVRQVLTESLLLSAAAGGAGIAVAYGAVALLRRLEPGSLPRLAEVGVDGTALGFAAATSMTVGMLFGLAPALSLGRGGGLREALSTTGRGSARRGGRARDVLVVAEVGFSFALLVGAALLGRSFLALRAVDPGFEADGAVSMPVSFAERAYPDLGSVDAARDAMLEQVAALEGVTAVGAASLLPLGGGQGDTYVYAEERPPAQIQDVANTAQIRLVDEGYFDVMRIPIAGGRAFVASDDRSVPDRVILNERLAEDLFPAGDAIGKRMVAWLDTLTALEVVGVASNVRQLALGTPPQREFYLSARQRGARTLELVARGRGGTEPPAAALREAVWEIDPGQPLSRVVPLQSLLAGSLAQDRFQAMLLGSFAALGLALAAIGVYGVLSQLVGERRREIGIRLAMGAERDSVTRMVVGRGLVLAAIGLGLGLAGALAGTRLLGSLLYGVGVVDPVTFVLTPAFLVAVVLLSSWLPARRAARTDPASVLREDG